VYEPQQVVGGQVFASVGAGRFHSCGLDVAGAAWCWGDDIAGQLGIPSSGADLRYQPTAVAGGHTFASLTVGSDNSCGTELSGTTWCWGFDLQGQVGDGSVGQQPYVHAAAMVDGSHQLSEVGSGGDHSCAVDRSKALWCWGSDAHGQLGDGPADQSDRFSPVPVTGGLVVRGPTNVAVPTA
jgi:alpha-tubulin suppressor-like RCC1 family protein